MSVACVVCRGPLPNTGTHECPGAPPRDDDPFGPLDYLANMIYQHSAQVNGQLPARWHRLPDADRAELRGRAAQLVAEWAGPEMQEAAVAGLMVTGRSLIRRDQ